MLNEIIHRLREENTWSFFTDKFTDMQNSIVEDMRKGNVHSLEELAGYNAKLELLEGLKNIDKAKF